MELETYLGVLAHLKSQEDPSLFERTAAELPRLVLARDVPLKTIAVNDRLRIDPDHIDHQPGPSLDLDG
jgi:hypothetical protein